MNLFQLYLLVVIPNAIDSLGTLAGLLSFITGLLLAAMLFFNHVEHSHSRYEEERESMEKAINKVRNYVFIPAVCVALFSLLVPDESEIRYMVGGYVVTNAEGINELPDNIMKAANSFLSEYGEGDVK